MYGVTDFALMRTGNAYFVDRTAEEAFAQIDERNYADKYDLTGKTVKKIGISFSSEKRTIVDWTAR